MGRGGHARRAARLRARGSTAALLLTLAAVAAWSGLAGADAADARETVRIVTPALRADAVSRTVEARVRVQGAVRRFRAVLSTPRGERDVSRRFRRSGREWTARLVAGRDLRPGVNGLLVAVTRPGGRVAADSTFFRSAPRRAKLVRSLRVRRGDRAPLAVGLTTTRRVDGLRATLNGRNVRLLFERAGPRAWTARLAANDGLRFGRNRLVITVIERRGAHERVRRTFVVPRGCPLLGAGPDGVERLSGPIRLDGRSSRPHRAGAELRLRWRIAGAPPRSRARLRGARGARPRLVGASPGVYRIQVRATRPPGCPPPAAPPAGAQVGPADSVTVAVQPDALPIGVPVETVVSATAPGIQVGQTLYPMGAGAIQMLALDRTTLTPAPIAGGANQSFPGTDAGVQALSAAVPADDEYLVFLSSPPGRPIQLSSQGVANLGSAAAGLGAQTLDVGGGNWTAALSGGGWSLIGIPGLPAGQAWSLFGMQQEPGQPAGAMQGNLVIDSTGQNYTFAWPFTFTPFDTQAPGSSSTQNLMTVDGATYTSETVAAGTAAFHIVALDAGSLALRSQATVPVTSDPTALASQLSALAQDAAPALVLMTSIGKPQIAPNPSADPAGWPAAVTALAGLGGNPNAVLALDGSGDYSLVGATGLGADGPNLGAELSQPVAGVGSPQLVGVLERGTQGTWRPGVNGSPALATSPAALQPEILQVLARPAQPFTPFPTAAQQAAEGCINDALGLGPLDPSWGIRANYWLNDDLQWGALYSQLQALGPCPGISPSAFATVQGQLETEFLQVDTVRGYFAGGGAADMNEIMLDAISDSSFGFDAVYASISSLYHPTAAARGPNALSLLGAMLGAVTPIAGPVAPFVAIVSAAANIAGQIANSQSGSSLMGATAFEASAGQFAATLEDDWQTALAGLDHVADLFVSDAGRLQTAFSNIQVSGAQGGWGLDTTSLDQLLPRIDTSIGQYMWYSLLPTVLYSYQCVVPPPQSAWYEESSGTPSRAQFPVTATVANYQGGAQIGQGFLSLAKPGDSPEFPSQSTFNTLFGTGTGQLGLLPPYFLAPAVTSGSTRTSAGFTLNIGTFYNYSNDGFYLYDCAGNSWQYDT